MDKGPLTLDECKAIVKECDTIRGGAYDNRAYPLDFSTCEVCGQYTLFAHAARNDSEVDISTCGDDRCVQQKRKGKANG